MEEFPTEKQAQVGFREIILYGIEDNPVKVWTFWYYPTQDINMDVGKIIHLMLKIL